MEIDTARILTANLLDRVSAASDGRTYRLDGAITQGELDALNLLAGRASVPVSPSEPRATQGLDHATSVTRTSETNSLAAVPIIGKAKLETAALVAEADPTVFACIDFGTAFSKAAVWKSDDSRPIPLDLEQAGSGTPGFTIPSSVYITGNSVFFGHRALEESRRENNPARERFDSPKQCLSIDDPDDIDRESVGVAIDPSQTFTRGDLLRLYLAYLTSCTAERMEAHGLSRHTQRRFAIPVWRGKQLESASSLLRRSLLEAQVIADSVDPEVWGKGISISFAKSLLNALPDLDAELIANSETVLDHVLEPMAAAAGLTDHVRNKKARVLVADIGAGTSDFGAYQFVLPAAGRARAHPFLNSESALKQAGNRLDEFLIRFIVERSGTPVGSDAAVRIAKFLMRDIRETKQTLFTVGSVFVSIPDFFDMTITRDEFSQDPHVTQFGRTIGGQIAKTIENAGAKNFTEDGVSTYAILTGGGAGLPMIRDLFNAPFPTSSGDVSLRLVDATPDWALDAGDDVLAIFPQLAVSSGGSSPDLIEVRSSVSDLTQAPRRVWGPRWT
ncbi:hypothetical protein LGH82_23590 [Mesorhizobium sp. PAMC28654]|uniref:hypothetical protein n=1 Tax=Mesorhizobium sp. PAMC28654 TaxID=2880934 RepID=UPI001D0A83C6|nr:hypothetical protein [Mesorhizobium sp. PAMC28654]UDL88120.1 hypothetical protein LGH82_23590 [Mesorhizobium sp. PAMC28654]